MHSKVLRVRNDWAEPVFKRATHPNVEESWPPWSLIFAVNEERSIIAAPGTRHDPCSGRGWMLGGVSSALGGTVKKLPP